MKTFTLAIIFILMSAKTFSQPLKQSEIITVNGKNLYYEVYGEGQPLIFLHGYSLSSNSWKDYVSDFSNEYEVYLIDLTGHGKSEAFKEDLNIKSVAEDLNSLLEYLKLNKIKAIGFSFGGDVLYQLALLNPNVIESMITIGALGTWSVKDFPEYEESYTFENVDNFAWMRISHSGEAQIRGIFDQFKNYTIK